MVAQPHKPPSLDPTLSQMNPNHTYSHPTSLKSVFILPFRLRLDVFLPKCSELDRELFGTKLDEHVHITFLFLRYHRHILLTDIIDNL
jgi:hypothetical protein